MFQKLTYDQQLNQFFKKRIANMKSENNIPDLYSENIKVSIDKPLIKQNDFNIQGQIFNKFEPKIKFRMDDKLLEFDYFKTLLLSAILQQPKSAISCMIIKDPFEMYLIARGQKPDNNTGQVNKPLEFY